MKPLLIEGLCLAKRPLPLVAPPSYREERIFGESYNVEGVPQTAAYRAWEPERIDYKSWRLRRGRYTLNQPIWYLESVHAVLGFHNRNYTRTNLSLARA